MFMLFVFDVCVGVCLLLLCLRCRGFVYCMCLWLTVVFELFVYKTQHHLWFVFCYWQVGLKTMAA
jgi:hypothetical protein